MNHTFRDAAIIYNYNIRNFCKYEVSFWDYNVCNFNDFRFANICTLDCKARSVDWPIRTVCLDDDYKAPALGSIHYPKDNNLRNIAKGDSYA